MYHYVRPVQDSDFPSLNALELDDFLGQLEHLQTHYNVISPAELKAAREDGVPLPPRACLLTFDDGYCDHYEHVFPRLVERGLSGLFFAPRSSLIDRKMLDPNLLQFTLASHPCRSEVANEIDSILSTEHDIDVSQLRAKHFIPNRFDGPEVAYAKRLIQHVLPARISNEIGTALFQKHVSTDVDGFAEELYLTPEQAREMRAAGMEFGGHGDRHLWHGLVSPDELASEVAGAVEAMRSIGAPVDGGYYCYPYGDETQDVRRSVSAAGFHFGFTVVPEMWRSSDDPMLIARLDTNDLPLSPRADDPWLTRAAGRSA